MTTNKPEVVASHHQNPEIKGVILRRDPSRTRPWIDSEPLIRLSDYEALQAECEKLRKDVARLEAALSQYADDYNWCYDTCNISRNIAKDALKEPANEG